MCQQHNCELCGKYPCDKDYHPKGICPMAIDFLKELQEELFKSYTIKNEEGKELNIYWLEKEKVEAMLRYAKEVYDYACQETCDDPEEEMQEWMQAAGEDFLDLFKNYVPKDEGATNVG